MQRILWACLLIAGVSPGIGCSMCASPYDYCGPTFPAEGQPCDFCYRHNSVLSGGPIVAGETYSDEVFYEPGTQYDSGETITTPEPMMMQSQPVPNAPRPPQIAPIPDSNLGR